MASALPAPGQETPGPFDVATAQYIQRVLDRGADGSDDPEKPPAPVSAAERRRLRQRPGGGRRRVLNDKMRDELAQCFAQLDVDGSGSIDADELLAAMALIGLKAPRAELLELINSVDTNRTGSLELAEFLELMTKHILVAEVKASNDFKVSMMIRRPVVLDTFPLVARSFDVHSTVARSTAPPRLALGLTPATHLTLTLIRWTTASAPRLVWRPAES
jgi:hypothetical protein